MTPCPVPMELKAKKKLLISPLCLISPSCEHTVRTGGITADPDLPSGWILVSSPFRSRLLTLSHSGPGQPALLECLLFLLAVSNPLSQSRDRDTVPQEGEVGHVFHYILTKCKFRAGAGTLCYRR